MCLQPRSDPPKLTRCGVQYGLAHCNAPTRRKAPAQSDPLAKMNDKLQTILAGIRAKVEHPFRAIKWQIGFVKVRYRGLNWNAANLHTLTACGSSHFKFEPAAVRFEQLVDGATRTAGRCGMKAPEMARKRRLKHLVASKMRRHEATKTTWTESAIQANHRAAPMACERTKQNILKFVNTYFLDQPMPTRKRR